LSLVGGVFKLLSVIHTCIPGGIAAGAEFELCPEGKDEWEIHLLRYRNWLLAWAWKSLAAGSGAPGSNQPGRSPRELARASRARPCGVELAAANSASDRPKFAAGLVMCTTWSGPPKLKNVLKANAESSAWFHVATPPESTPHMGSAASKRLAFL